MIIHFEVKLPSGYFWAKLTVATIGTAGINIWRNRYSPDHPWAVTGFCILVLFIGGVIDAIGDLQREAK